MYEHADHALSRLEIVLSNVLALRACVEQARWNDTRVEGVIATRMLEHVQELSGHAERLAQLIRRGGGKARVHLETSRREHLAFPLLTLGERDAVLFLSAACRQVASLVDVVQTECGLHFDGAADGPLLVLAGDLRSRADCYGRRCAAEAAGP